MERRSRLPSGNLLRATKDMAKVEIETRQMDMNMNPGQGAGSRANEVMDEFLPKLITDDEVLDLPDSNLTEEEKEERERDAFIQQLEDEVNDFASARRIYDLTARNLTTISGNTYNTNNCFQSNCCNLQLHLQPKESQL